MRQPRWIRDRRLEQVLVHTVGGDTIAGALLRAERDAIILVQARFFDGNEGSAASVPMAGEVYVPRERVAFIQKP